MQNLMSTNVYQAQGTVLVAGSCLGQTEPEAFRRLCSRADCVYTLCLEETHLNMAVTKLAAMLGTGRVTRMIFASVDGSPHCTQLHYIPHEIRRTFRGEVTFESCVIDGGEILNATL